MSEETTLTLHGDCLQSFYTGPHECDSCHWFFIPYAEGKFYKFCPGCGKRIRHDVVKQCDPSGKCPHGHQNFNHFFWPK
jgi:predicted amidophosphoribosyltransferase